jgi:tetraacyldisaccharide 4'-kinase
LLALAAIAQPEAFFAMLRAQGLSKFDSLSLPDHYNFESFSLNEYGGYRLICTEKDAVKLWPLRPDALAVPLTCTLPDALCRALDQRIDALLAAAQNNHEAA